MLHDVTIIDVLISKTLAAFLSLGPLKVRLSSMIFVKKVVGDRKVSVYQYHEPAHLSPMSILPSISRYEIEYLDQV
jgi:hypothetical protein